MGPDQARHQGWLLHRIPGKSVGESIVGTFAPGSLQLIRPELQDQTLKSRIHDLIKGVPVQDRIKWSVICDHIEKTSMEK